MTRQCSQEHPQIATGRLEIAVTERNRHGDDGRRRCSWRARRSATCDGPSQAPTAASNFTSPRAHAAQGEHRKEEEAPRKQPAMLQPVALQPPVSEVKHERGGRPRRTSARSECGACADPRCTRRRAPRRRQCVKYSYNSCQLRMPLAPWSARQAARTSSDQRLRPSPSAESHDRRDADELQRAACTR